MKIQPIQEIYTRKFNRQRSIDGLEYHASGHCVHIGKLSPGCQACFVPGFSRNIRLGSVCNLDCIYCHETGRDNPAENNLDQIFADLAARAREADTDAAIPRLSFSGGGDPLMHVDIIEDILNRFQGIAQSMRMKPWTKIYTNGLLATPDTIMRLRAVGVDEIRFHIGASDFSPTAFDNMEKAARQLGVVTVETPAWPPHRSKLFEMLPVIEDIGVKHVNLGEVMLTRANYRRISRALPDAEVYHCYELHLYDGGLVYDLMEEVLKKGYSYSVLDCSGFVKSLQRSPGKSVAYEDVAGLCADYGDA